MYVYIYNNNKTRYIQSPPLAARPAPLPLLGSNTVVLGANTLDHETPNTNSEIRNPPWLPLEARNVIVSDVGL
jgi:hypothetical protein